MTTSFEQGPVDYRITGSSTWDQLSTSAQDEYILACFNGERARDDAERRVRLFDRAASSIADGLLGRYRQWSDEGPRYEPGTPIQAAEVLAKRRQALSGTPLGFRLEAAIARLHGSEFDQAVPPLKFYSVAPAVRGMEVLRDECCRGSTQEAQRPWPGAWNDFGALHLWQQRQLNLTAPILKASLTPVESNPSGTTAPKPKASNKTGEGNESSWALAGPSLLACAMLLWGLGNWNPYGFYMLLRYAVCGVALWLLLHTYIKEWKVTSWALALTAVVYNPLIRLHLGREVWTVVNVATIGLLLAVAWRFVARPNTQK